MYIAVVIIEHFNHDREYTILQGGLMPMWIDADVD